MQFSRYVVQSHTACSRGLNSVSGYLSQFHLVSTATQAMVRLLATYVSYICTAFYFMSELWRLGSDVWLTFAVPRCQAGHVCLWGMMRVKPFRILLMSLILLIINLCYI